MIFPTTPHTTYNEAIAADPTIETGLENAGYSAATISGIRDWFGTRIVCDEIYFKQYFLRLAAPLAGKYNAQLRLETVDSNMDPFVENYSEHYIEHGGIDTITPAETTVERTPAGTTVTRTPAETTTTEAPAETTKTETPAGYTITESPAETTKTHKPAAYTDRTTYGQTSTRSGNIEREESGFYEDTVETDNDSKGLGKQNPMSSTSVTTGNGDAANGEIQGLTWAYSSAQDQRTDKGYSHTKHDNSGTPTTTETYNSLKDELGGSDSTARTFSTDDITSTEVDKSGSKSLTAGAAGTTTVEVDKAGTKKVEVDNAETIVTRADDAESVQTTIDQAEQRAYGRTIKERYTGRAGLTPQKALTEAITYLRTISPAFFDLMMKLEPAFYGVYDL